MTERMVLVDPSGKLPPGAIVNEGQGRAIDLAENGCAIPCERELLPMHGEPLRHRRSAIAGVFRRDLGLGWRLADIPGALVPLALYVGPGFPGVHWRAKLVLRPELHVAERIARGETEPVRRPLAGKLRISPESSQPNGAFVLAVDGEHIDLAKLQGAGPWYVGGRAKCQATGEGALGMTLYGHASGDHPILIEWAAVSSTRAW